MVDRVIHLALTEDEAEAALAALSGLVDGAVGVPPADFERLASAAEAVFTRIEAGDYEKPR